VHDVLDRGEPWKPGSNVLLLFECADKVVHAERTNDVQIIVEDFEYNAILSTNAVKDYCFTISGAVPVRVVSGVRRVTASSMRRL
jgi:hypothetical protein